MASPMRQAMQRPKLRQLVYALLLCALCPYLIPSQACADDLKDCAQSKDYNREIRGCSAILKRKNISKKMRSAVLGNLYIGYMNRGSAHLQKNEFEGAINDFNLALKSPNKKVRSVAQKNVSITYLNRGVGYFNTKNYEKAIADFTLALTSSDKKVRSIAFKDLCDSYVERGLDYYNKGDYEKAISAYDHVLEMINKEGSPPVDNIYAVYVDRGLAYAAKGEYQKAIAEYDRAIEKNPKSGTAYSGRGFALAVEGNYDKGINDLNRAIEIENNKAYFYYQRGRVLAYLATGAMVLPQSNTVRTVSYVRTMSMKTADYDKAIADFDRAIQLNPKFSEAYVYRGHLKSFRSLLVNKEGIFDEGALSDYSKAISLDPSQPGYFLARATQLSKKGKQAEADADCDQAAKLDAKIGSKCRELVSKTSADESPE